MGMFFGSQLAPASHGYSTYRGALGNHWQAIHADWLEAIAINLRGLVDPDRDGTPRVDSRIVLGALDLVETVCTRPEGTQASLTRFGAMMGADGWHLERVSAWVAELAARLPRKARKNLRNFLAGAALAEGWAAEYVRGAGLSRCTYAVTGLPTPAVLRLRLHEVFGECCELNVPARHLYMLVVAEISVDELPAFERDVMYIRLANVVGEVFNGGETLARQGRRVVVLASSSERTADKVAQLTERLRSDCVTATAPAFVWTEELPDTAHDIDRYISDLTMTA
jgi:hypothetical protein